jgi:hypothetical protein
MLRVLPVIILQSVLLVQLMNILNLINLAMHVIFNVLNVLTQAIIVQYVAMLQEVHPLNAPVLMDIMII